MFDIVIKNGTVIDGTGSEGKVIDIGISGEKIARLSPGIFEEAVLIINAKDHFVTPGFIDIHSHADLAFLDSASSPKLMQGVTTEVIGNCGLSVAPIKDENKGEWAKLFSGVWGLYDFSWNWNSFGEYLKILEQNPLSSNAASLLGYGAVRLKVMGMKNSVPSEEEQEALKAELASAMESGAYGLSLGLLYPPCCYSTSQELIEAANVVKKYGGYLACHIRSEGDTLLESAKEVISIAEASGVRLHISHLKSYGKKNWYKVDELLSVIEKANEAGLEVTFDQYPYTAGSTTMVALLPNWVQEGGLEKMLDLISRKDIKERIADEIREGIPGWENYGGVAGMENIVVTYAGTSKNKLPRSKTAGHSDRKIKTFRERA